MGRSSIHMRLGSGLGDVVGSDGKRVLCVLDKLRLCVQDRASGVTDSGGEHHHHHHHLGKKKHDAEKEGRNHQHGPAFIAEEDLDVLQDWVQEAMSELSSRSKMQREESKMRSQFSKILDASTQEYMLAMFTSNSGGDSATRTGHADSHTGEQPGQADGLDDDRRGGGAGGAGGEASGRRSAYGREASHDAANLRVVNCYILCSPTAASILTTKGERLLGRTRVVSGWMLKKGDTNKLWTNTSVRRRFFLLRDGLLEYYKSDVELAKSAATPMRAIDLSHVVMMRPTMDETAPAFTFDLEVKLVASGSSRTFLFCPEGPEATKLAWVARIAAQVPPGCVAETLATMGRSTLAGVDAAAAAAAAANAANAAAAAAAAPNGNGGGGGGGGGKVAQSGNKSQRLRAGQGASSKAHLTAAGMAPSLVTGWMFKKGETSKKWMYSSVKRRFFVLQGRALKYYITDLDLDHSAPIKTVNLASVTSFSFSNDDTAPAFAFDMTVALPSGYSRTFVFAPLGEEGSKLHWATSIAEQCPVGSVGEALRSACAAVSGMSLHDLTTSRGGKVLAPILRSRALTMEQLRGDFSHHEGWMFKKGETTKSWKTASIKRRWFVLSVDTLRYYASQEAHEAGQAPLNALNLSEALSLQYTDDITAPPLAMDLRLPASAVRGGDDPARAAKKLMPSMLQRSQKARTFVLSPAGEDWSRKNWGSVLCRAVPADAVATALREACSVMLENELDEDEVRDRESIVDLGKYQEELDAAAAAAGGGGAEGAAGGEESGARSREPSGAGGGSTAAAAAAAAATAAAADAPDACGPPLSPSSGGKTVGFADDADAPAGAGAGAEVLQRRRSDSELERTHMIEEEEAGTLQKMLQECCSLAPHDARMHTLLGCVKSLDQWDFDIFAVAETVESPLVFVGVSLFFGYDFLDTFGISR
jgi:hypothetical protein